MFFRPLTDPDIGFASSAHIRSSQPTRWLMGSLWLAGFLLIAVLPTPACSATPLRASRASHVSHRWTIVKRTQTQDQGDWQVDYEIRLDSSAAIELEPADLGLAVRAVVSNSRVPSHAVPYPIATVLSGQAGSNVLTDVIASGNDLSRCRERVVARFWTGESAEPPMPIAPHLPLAPLATPLFEPFSALNVAPGGLIRVRLRLEHDHFLHGPYDPLLGRREVDLVLGADVLRDLVPLDREQYLAQSRETWTRPPEERRDTRHFVTGPDSLSLEAHIPGNQSYRFAEIPVRYATKMRLTFWYLVAPGTDGDFRMQLTQYKDSPNGWQILHAGMIEKTYKPSGRWVKVEQVFRTEAQATSLALTFRIVGPSDVGEIWVDGISLEPIGGASDRP